MAKRRRYTPEQVIRRLREGERLSSTGQDLAAGCKHLEDLRADLVSLAQPVRRDEGR